MALFPPNIPTAINFLPLEHEFTPSISSLTAVFQNEHVLVPGGGLSLSYTMTETPPSVSFTDASDARKPFLKRLSDQEMIFFYSQSSHPEASYTVLLTDPDAPIPSDNKYAYWRHWIVAGLRAKSVSVEDSEGVKGESVGCLLKDMLLSKKRAFP